MQQTTSSFPWAFLYCDSTTAIFIPIGPYLQAPAVQFLRSAFELRARIGLIQVQAAYQTANDPRSPDTPVGYGGTRAAEGFEDPSDLTDVGATFKAKELWRPGFLCSNTSGTSQSLAYVTGSIFQVFR